MAEKEQQHPHLDRTALVLFGTETGTAQDIAEEISRILQRLHFSTDIVGLDHVKYETLKSYNLTVFAVATTGQGDFPDNARKFWTSLLRRKLSSTTLSGINYALIGLCDSSYTKFNWAARKLDKRLQQLGANPLLEACEADEQGDESTDGSFLAWSPLLRDAVLSRFPLAPGLQPIPNDVVLPSKWRLQPLAVHESNNEPSRAKPASHPALGGLDDNTVTVELTLNQRVTPPSHWQDVRFMSLELPEQMTYMPGDALAISPKNLSSDVSTLLDLQRWNEIADDPIQLTATNPRQNGRSSLSDHNPINAREDLTLRVLLSEYLDINAIPRRSFFAAIANHTTNEMHKERLVEFTDPQYLDEYYDYATRPRRSIIEILQEFDSVQLPWEEVINIIPSLRPRQFSIASGGRLKQSDHGGTKFELLVAIVKYRTVIKRIREGVCTKYLAQLPVGSKLQVSLKTEGRFLTPNDLATNSNHILIGAGTGIAPLRALIHEKTCESAMSGLNVLFFGCRSHAADYYFHDEWKTLAEASLQGKSTPHMGSTFEVIPAFSRDQSAKVYVQNQIRARADLVWTMLREQEATIILCGSSGQMPKAVRQALVDALVEQASLKVDVVEGVKGPSGDADEPISSPEDAERYLTRLEKLGRFKQETWS
ncbi:hypothetical protein PV10_05371 [Exophiala mesophila]|uniref:NADPH-dependent diflavin oxidoreductase 1 n=1 Tax=Exophiala mesophila TaxID=212818 RepID=A0A0D1Z7F6_EXOME|nr:uncharacterized protein PV10_05371 [Exophiala mesophila]KIV90747.1 hypothetical protein PV10_05371 [Exophiala mesophila]